LITEGGLTAATRGLAIEYASRGIRVNAVAPGAIKTSLYARETHEAVFEFDRVASGNQGVHVMGQQSLPQQAERLAEAFARLRLSAVFTKQGGERGPFVGLSAVKGKVCQQRLRLFDW
jgi:NAD(P)-dependent dehydrogenase (short-subunit alcohol dehydrogenase family)